MFEQEIKRLFERCIDHTRNIINNPGAADILQKGGLGKNFSELKRFIANCLGSSNGQRNGVKIRKNGGISLEEIVLLFSSEFSGADVTQAQNTLRQAH